MGIPWAGNSKWIWLSKWDEVDNAHTSIVYFRKQFEIKNKAEKAILKVSADSRYRLYVNGVSVSFGPCKGDRFQWYYDEVDVSSYLHTGENVIAASVLRYPADRAVGNQSIWRTDTPGFYISGSVVMSDGNQFTLDTDSSWKVHKCTNISIVPEGGLNFLWVQENCVGSESLHGWNTTGYCDDSWLNAKPYRNQQIQENISPADLSPRPIPMLYENPKLFCEAFSVKNTSIKKETWNSLLEGGSEVTIPPNSREVVDISAGELTTGFLQLRVAHGKDSKINILVSEAYAYPPENTDIPNPSPVKGDRLDCENGKLYGFTDIFSPGGFGTKENPEYYEPFWFRTFRFISLEITTQNDPLTLVSFDYRETGYPLEVKTNVDCSDAEMQRIWDISLRTLKRCMHETYEDCPFYEQLQYAMDTRSQILFTYNISGDDRLARKCIDDFHRSLRPDGLTNCCYPQVGINVIPGFSLYYILMIHDHMMYFGDKSLIKKYLPTIDRILEFFDSHLTEQGLVDKIGGPLGDKFWSFVDWTKEWKETHGSPSATLLGPITMESFLYAYTLKASAEIAEYMGRGEFAEGYSKRSKAVINSINRNCLGGNGLYQDGPGVNDYSQHCQVWAILTEAVETKDAKALMWRTLEDKSLAQCSVAMAYYMFRAVEKAGLYEQTEQLWQPWRDMLADNLTTCVEDPVLARSDCHAWGSLALYELPAVTLGVRPMKPGFEEVSINPNPGYFRWAKGKVITPRGVISVDWKQQNGETVVNVEVPDSIKVVK